MKKLLFLTNLLLFGFLLNAAAKQIQVSASGFAFSPKNFTAAIGDTIRFVWVSGTHTTTSTSVPAGAATWDAPLDNTHTTFLYVIKVGGSYAFKCIYHEAMGMVGSFTVPPRTNITTLKATSANDCSATNSLRYKCNQSTPPFKVQLYRYGIAYGNVRLVSDTLPFTYSNLPQGSYYATARGNNGTDSLVGKSTKSSLMPVPSGIFDTHVKSTTATIKWNHLTCVKFYSVQYRKQGVTTWTKLNTNGNKDSLNLTGLTANTKYQFHVASNDSANKIVATSKYSAVDSFKTTASGILITSESPVNNRVAKENSLSKPIVVFPNPASSFFTIQTNGNHFSSAQLRSIDGIVVWNATRATLLENDKINVNISKVSPGSYFLILLDNNNKRFVEKIVIER